MRIAAPLDESGFVSPLFDKAITFRLYDTEDEEILSSEDIELDEDNKASMLYDCGIDAVICRNLGPEAMIDLALRNIEIIGGVKEKADRAVLKYLNGTLDQDDIVCECGGSCQSCLGTCSSCH